MTFLKGYSEVLWGTLRSKQTVETRPELALHFFMPWAKEAKSAKIGNETHPSEAELG